MRCTDCHRGFPEVESIVSAKIKSLSGPWLFFWCVQAIAQNAFPPDVAKFVERRDGCDHFRGEEPYDEERRLFLLQNMKELCTGTDRQLAELKEKYAGQPHVMKKLNDYEAQIEPAGKK